MGTGNAVDRILHLAGQRGILRARDLDGTTANPRMALARLVAAGRLQKLSRGLYAFPHHIQSAQHQLAEVALRSPQGVFCLLTTLRFHNFTTQAPFEVWIAIPNKARAPKIDYPPLRIVRFSGPALTEGIETRQVDGVAIRVYSAAKTVADCFKYRNKLGLDVALEALRECRRGKLATNDELWRYARICRVANIMRPYLESIE